MTKQKWAAFYAAVVFIDIFQIILDLIGIGIIVNRAIDFFVFLLLPFSLHLAGVDMTDPKKIASMLGAGTLEMIPGIDALPLWTLDLFVIHTFSKVKETLKNKPLVSKIIKPLNKDGVRLPRKPDTI